MLKGVGCSGGVEGSAFLDELTCPLSRMSVDAHSIVWKVIQNGNEY